MSDLVAVVVLVLVLVVVVAIVTAPLRRDGRGEGAAGADAPGPGPGALSLEDLESAREAKYREIRDAELDYRTGKLARADYEAIDAELRAEALEILDRIERLSPS